MPSAGDSIGRENDDRRDRLARVRTSVDVERSSQPRVEHDAPWSDARRWRVAHGQRGIVGEHGANADGDRVGVGAQAVHLARATRAR